MPNHKPPAAASPEMTEAAAPAKRLRGGAKGLRITDVAAQAGVATITVSRVFISPETVAP